MGHDVSIIDYRPAFLFQPYKIFERGPLSGGWKRFVHLRTLLYDYKVSYIRWKRKKTFELFEKRQFKRLAMSATGGLDAVVVGSDQIWNPRITDSGFDATYFLPASHFKKNQLKISYAASAGKARFFSDHMESRLASLLNDFTAISVREKALGNAVEKLTHNEIPVVCDPVLLGGKDIFNHFINSRLIPAQPYILYFSLVHQKEQYRLFRKIANNFPDHKVVVLFSQSVIANDSDVICNASVEHFLSLISGADYVVTSSFHGTAFSILFGKQFVSIGDNINNTERLQELLDELGIGERLVIENNSDGDIAQKGINLLNTQVDYDTAYARLSNWRSRSKKFLQSALATKNKG